MPEATKSLVVGISSNALFDLDAEEEIARTRSADEYRRHQAQRDADTLEPGRAMPIAQALQRLGERSGRRCELVVFSGANADSSPRIFASMHEQAVHATRAAFTGGEPVAPYLRAFHVDLYLSAQEEDVRAAIAAGTPAAMVTTRPEHAKQAIDQIRIVFDGDAAVFGHEDDEDEVRPEGAEKSLAKLMKAIAELQAGDAEKRAVRTALLTRRASPAQERALKSMREWNVRLDEAFFVGDLPREQLLEAFRAHLLFEDGASHFRVPEEIVKADLRATKEEAHASSQSPFARLRLRSHD